MSVAEAPAAATAPAGPASRGPAGGPAAPRIFGESLYDRVTSMLMAIVIGAAMVAGLLSAVAATTLAFQAKVAQPIHVVEVSGGGGGTPDGAVGSIESVDVPGGEAADMASNNDEEAADFEEPSVEARPTAMLDTVADSAETLAEVDVSTVTPNGSRVASGKKRSKIGTGGPGFGSGPGDGGVRREDRWSILYKVGQTADEYARQLDAFGVEMAIPSGNQLVYVYNFSKSVPDKRTGPPSADKRLYFVWQGKVRKEHDIALLSKAGLDVGEKIIFQFYPPKTESILEQLEVRYRRRQPAEIRSTRFAVVPAGSGYSFEVIAQEPLR